MTRWNWILVGAAVALLPVAAHAQSRLSLTDAIARAQAQNLDVRSAASAERQAGQRVEQARAGYFPRVDASQAWQRGNQPVFVFSSLLAQRRFTEANFVIDSLNHPDAVGNLRTSVSVEQAVFDATTLTGVRAATLAQEVAVVSRSRLAQDLAVDVSRAYGTAVVAAAVRAAANGAVETATADLELARNRRDAGMVTDADVLQLDVVLARARELQIRAEADVTIAQARLNEILGEPLDTLFALDDLAASPSPTEASMATLETSALVGRPDVKVASLHEQLATTSVQAARAAFMPRVTVQAGWEANASTWSSPSSSWMVGAVGQINLFRGFADRARLAEARELQSQRAIERQRVEVAVRVDVRVAVTRLEAARAAESVGRAAATQARESHRIIRDRYEGGLADVSVLVRAAEAVQQADASAARARVDVVVAAAELTRAVGSRR